MLASDVMHLNKISYHAIKNNLITGYKSVFNRKNNKFELRSFLTDDSNKINWSSNPCVPSNETFISWEKSFNEYINRLKINNSSSNSTSYI